MADESKLTLPDYFVNDDFILTFTQLLSYFPWLGIPWKVTRGQRVWSDIVLVGLVIGSYFGCKRVFEQSLSFEKVFIRTVGVVKLIQNFVTIVLIRRIRSKWFLLSKIWTMGNHTLPEMRTSHTKLRKNMFWILLAFIILTIMDRMYLILASVELKTSSMAELLDRYVSWARKFVATSSWCAPYLATLLSVLMLCGPVVANIQDFIIVAFSMGLAERQRRLNKALRDICDRNSYWREKLDNINATTAKSTINNEIVVWRKLREAFVRHSTLVAMVDETIGPLILLSVFTNLLYLLMYTVFGFNPAEKSNMVSQGFYVFAAFRISLTCFIVLLKSSDVHNLSTSGLKYLRTCSMKNYCNIEVRRLYFQLSKNEVALNGMGFFRLRRIFILKALSIIITYGLMLLQYNDRLSST